MNWGHRAKARRRVVSVQKTHRCKGLSEGECKCLFAETEGQMAGVRE